MTLFNGPDPLLPLRAVCVPRLSRISTPGTKLCLSLLVATAIMPLPAQAQTQVLAPATPDRQLALNLKQSPGDSSCLAEPANATGRLAEPFKDIFLDGPGAVCLTTGLEARVRYESFENVEWGVQPDNDYVWNRVLLNADLRLGRVRVFVQPIISDIAGSNRAASAADTTGADMLQAFVDVDLDVGVETSLRLSVGRSLKSLGAGRLVDNRYGVNVPQAFDGAEVTLTHGTRRLTALGLRPVDNLPGDFDDETSDRKALWGLYGTQWLTGDQSSGFDVYWLGFRDRNAVFDQGSGRQVVHTFGVRLFGTDGPWRWNLEGAVQSGKFAGARSAAWGVGGELGRRLETLRLKPDLALSIDVISGDDDPNDPKLGTFNPLFPKGRYFLSQSPIGARNLIHIQPSVTLHPTERVDITLMGAAYWRQSTSDGIYSIPGFLVRSGRTSDARFIGSQVELSVTWRATPGLDLSVSSGAFEAGSFIRETGPSKTILLTSAMVTFRY